MKTRKEAEWDGMMELATAVMFAGFIWVIIAMIFFGILNGVSWLVNHIHLSVG